MAVEKENLEIVKVLLTNDKIDINILKSESFGKKFIKSDKKIIKSNMLYYAILNNKNKALKLFLSECKNNKIDLSAKLFEAIIGKEIEIIEKPPLYIAVENKNIEAVQLLILNKHINVNEKSYHFIGNARIEERTPLHLAVENGYIEIIKLLLECKEIDINIEDEQAKKPIDYASNDEIKQLLNH